MDIATSSPVIAPSFKAADENLILKNLMDLLEKFSEKREIVIAFDEFQEVAKYTNADSFEKQLSKFDDRLKGFKISVDYSILNYDNNTKGATDLRTRLIYSF